MILNPYLASMNRTAGLILMITFMFISCNRIPNPRFSWYPENDLECGDSIWFFDDSKRADELIWEFGDGQTSFEYDPVHVYDSTGVFHVHLTATNDHGENLQVEDLVIHEPTILGFWVMDSTGNSSLIGAEVSAYENAPDRDSLLNPLYVGLTGTNGRVEFRNVDRQVYYVNVILSQTGGCWKFRGKTSLLDAYRTNYFTVHCDWEPDEQHL